MKFYFFLIIFLLIKINISDTNSGQKNFKNLDKKAKVLACTYLSKIFLDSFKNDEKIFKDLLKDNSLGKTDAEKKERISHFMAVNCYLKITKELANNVILEVSKGNKDIIKKKEYYELFEMSKNKDMNKIKETMKEIGDILKEIKEEEELFRKKGGSPDFEKAYKEYEEKMKKNNNYKKKNEDESSNKKKKKKSGKKPYEGTKWEVVKPSGDNFFAIRDIIFNPQKFFEETGINTYCGMCIMALIFINIYQSFIYIKKEEKSNINEKKENEININNINNINKIENDNGEEEEKEEEEKEEIIENKIKEKDDNNIIENIDNNNQKNE